MKAWLYQDAKQVKARGAKAASWYVGWTDPDGRRRCKSCGPGVDGKKLAGKLQKKIHAELILGVYDEKPSKSWKSFVEEYTAKVLDGMESATRRQTRAALDRFEEKVNPKLVASITSRTIADFIAQRRTDPGKKAGSVISKASINKELRHLHAVLGKAHQWGYLARMPEVEFLREEQKLPVYIPADQFAKLYASCDAAELPCGIPNVSGVDWWRAFLMFAVTTGWRVSEILALQWDDVSLEHGTAITRSQDNKGRRDDIISLAGTTVEHLARIQGSFGDDVFPFPHCLDSLYAEFNRIQDKAQVKPAGKDRYTFHDLRRSFATLNAGRMSSEDLQRLMRHRSPATTKRYIAMAEQVTKCVEVFVPEVGKVG